MDEGLEVGVPAPEVEDLEERGDVLFVCVYMCMCICLIIEEGEYRDMHAMEAHAHL
jgi:hypothetical protein